MESTLSSEMGAGGSAPLSESSARSVRRMLRLTIPRVCRSALWLESRLSPIVLDAVAIIHLNNLDPASLLNVAVVLDD